MNGRRGPVGRVLATDAVCVSSGGIRERDAEARRIPWRPGSAAPRHDAARIICEHADFRSAEPAPKMVLDQFDQLQIDLLSINLSWIISVTFCCHFFCPRTNKTQKSSLQPH